MLETPKLDENKAEVKASIDLQGQVRSLITCCGEGCSCSFSAAVVDGPSQSPCSNTVELRVFSAHLAKYVKSQVDVEVGFGLKRIYLCMRHLIPSIPYSRGT